jgi:hypothetical protein
MTERAPIRDCGPEFRRRFASTLYRIGREADRFTIADEIQVECDRLRAEEEAANARRA